MPTPDPKRSAWQFWALALLLAALIAADYRSDSEVRERLRALEQADGRYRVLDAMRDYARSPRLHEVPACAPTRGRHD